MLNDDDVDLFEDQDVEVFYAVVTHAYCGMVLPHGEFETIEEARDRVNRRIRYLRDVEETEVVELSEDEYEVLEPEGCQMVPDFCGILTIERRTR